MLLVEPITTSFNVQCDSVRCPVCKRGRLCDKPLGLKAKTISVTTVTASTRLGAALFLKCPKCTRVIGVTMLQEN